MTYVEKEMNLKRAFVEYKVTQPTANFAIPFEFVEAEQNLRVRLNGIDIEDLGYSFLLTNNITVQVTPAIPHGTLSISRETDIDENLYKFTAGALFEARTMDKNFEQIRHSQQEVRDGFDKLTGDVYPLVDGLEVALEKADEASKAAQEAADAAEEAADAAEEAAQVTRSASQVTDESGLNQQEWNNGVASIVDLLTISNPKNGSRVFTKGFQGGWFKYNSLTTGVNNGHSIFNGWERQVPYLHVSPLQWGADPTGQNDSTAAFKSFRDHLQYMAFNSTYPPVACIPAGYYVVRDEIEFYDLSNCTIYSLGAMIGYVGSKVSDSIIKINNAVNTKILGSLTLTAWGQDNAQCGLLITASTGSLLQADGIANHIDIIGVTARNLVCGFQIGEDLQDYDKHVAELHFIGCNTMVCRTAVRNYGSQTESSFDGCTLASGFFNETDTSVYHALLDIRGGIVTINGGSLVNSMLPSTFTNSRGFDVRPALSTQYNNPYPVVAIDTVHIELTTAMLNIAHGGHGGGDSAISNVSIQNCKGWMGMLPSEVLIRIWDASYVGKLSIGSSNNFYTSLNRTGKNIICDAPNAILDVSSMAFGMQMQQGFGSIIGGILKHPLKLISQTHSLNSTLAKGKQAIVFTTANGYDDLARYAVYNTTNGNIQFPHKVKSINIKVNIVDSGINVVGDIFIEKNGAIVCFANKNTTFATMDYTDNDVLSTDVYRVCFSKSDAVTLLSGSVSNISIFAET